MSERFFCHGCREYHAIENSAPAPSGRLFCKPCSEKAKLATTKTGKSRAKGRHVKATRDLRTNVDLYLKHLGVKE